MDSRALALTQSLRGFQERVAGYLLAGLAQRGFPQVTAAQLSFLGALDCGENHAAAIARTLGVSRQAVHKTVRELEAAGWLETSPDAAFGNQRVIRFTVEGERMMAEARRLFADLDDRLAARFGDDALEAALAVARADISAPDDANGS